MSNIEEYPAVIVGSGEAGKYLAWSLAKGGTRTAVVERSLVGGACPNVACLPSKNVIHSAKAAWFFRHGDEFGLETESWRVDMAKVRERKRRMVRDLAAIHMDRFAASGAELVMGEGRFVGPRTIEVALRGGGMRTLRGEKVFLNLGTKASMPEVEGLADAQPLTHVEALELDIVPRRLILVGGGYVGLEFAQAFRRFGSEVVVVQRSERLLPDEDADVSDAVLEILKKEGVEVLLSAAPTRVEGRSGSSVRVHVGQDAVIEGTHLLVATGRTPLTQWIDAAAGGVDLDERGYIRVNDRLETSAENVWAMGDCAGSPLFTHVSYDDFRTVKENLAGGRRSTAGRIVPWTLFTDPELARIGLSETEAKAKGIPYRLAKLPMGAVLRTRTLDEQQGFMKALVGEDDRILGFMALGVSAGEIMAMVQVAMIGGVPYTSLRDAMFTHPTLAEGLVFLFGTVPPR